MHKVRFARIRSLTPMFIIINLAVGGVADVYSVCRFLNVQCDVWFAAICAMSIAGIYLLNRASDVKEDFINNHEVSSGTGRTYHLIAGSVFIFVPAFLLFAGKQLSLYYMVLLSVGVAYSFPLLPWYSSRRGLFFFRIKQVPFAKAFVVASLWGISVFALPLLYYAPLQQLANSQTIVLLCITFILSTFHNTLFSDIRDMPGDCLAGNATIPLLIGKRNAYVVLFADSFLLIIVAILLTAFQTAPSLAWVIPLIMAAYAMLYLTLHKVVHIPEDAMEIVVDMQFAIFALAMCMYSGTL